MPDGTPVPMPEQVRPIDVDRDRDVPMIVVKLLDGENVEVDEQLVMVDQPSLPTESIARFVLELVTSDPTSDGLRRRAELIGDHADRLPLRPELVAVLAHEPDRLLAQ